MIYNKGQLPSIGIEDKNKVRKFDDDLLRYLNLQDENLIAIFENGIRFDENFNASEVTFTSNAVANTEDAISHTLGKVPVGFLVIGLNKGAVLYNGGTTDTAFLIHLKSTVASTTFKILVF